MDQSCVAMHDDIGNRSIGRGRRPKIYWNFGHTYRFQKFVFWKISFAEELNCKFICKLKACGKIGLEMFLQEMPQRI